MPGATLGDRVDPRKAVGVGGNTTMAHAPTTIGVETASDLACGPTGEVGRVRVVLRNETPDIDEVLLGGIGYTEDSGLCNCRSP